MGVLTGKQFYLLKAMTCGDSLRLSVFEGKATIVGSITQKVDLRTFNSSVHQGYIRQSSGNVDSGIYFFSVTDKGRDALKEFEEALPKIETKP